MKGARWMMVAASIGFVVAAALACGTQDDEGARCTNCPGCCDASGHCRAGNSIGACGTGGGQCRQCSPTQACVAGLCLAGSAADSGVDAHTACGPQTCAGCCRSDGACVAAAVQNAESCGAGGEACQQCPAGRDCVNGECSAPPCGPQTCGGCCSPDGQCMAGNVASACGSQGRLCTGCSSAQVCSGGTCVAAPCGPGTCSGCCAGTSRICLPGSSPTNCGSGGQACISCQPGQACVVSAGGGGACKAISGIGDPCASDADCANVGPGGICKRWTTPGSAPYPGGYCSKNCITSGDCGSSAACISLTALGESNPLCLKLCGALQPCRTGYACYQTSFASVCWISPLPTWDGGAP